MLTKSHLKRSQQEELLQCFILDDTATKAAKRAKTDRNTANKWYGLLRQIITEASRTAPRFTGHVEMDQAFFGHKRRQAKKVKKPPRSLSYGMLGVGYPSGYKSARHREEDLLQVFGLIKRKHGKTPSAVYLHIIRRGDRKTLLPIIHLVVDGKATVYSDNHRTFDNLKDSGYKHGIINKYARKHSKSRKFWSHKTKESTGSIYTNTIESFWSWSKGRLEKFKGMSRETYPLHLKECEFRFNHRHDLEKAIRALLKDGASAKLS